MTAGFLKVVAACIVKNEAHNLPDLFVSAKGLVDAWVIVDTGSDDDTVETAKRLGDQHGVPVVVHEDAWDDDFARSRNVSLDLVDALCGDATGEGPVAFTDREDFGAWCGRRDNGDPIDPNPWVIVLDGDDRFDAPHEARDQLVKLTAGYLTDFDGVVLDLPFVGIRVDSPTHNGLMETLTQVRIFRRRERIRYVYPVHAKPDLSAWEKEQIAKLRAEGAGDLTLPSAWALEDCRVLHIGYRDPGHHAENLERTLRILRAKMEPNDPFRMAYEARALGAQGKWDEVLSIIQKLDTHDPDEPIDANTALLSAQAYLNACDAPRDATEVLLEATWRDGLNLDLWHQLLVTAARGFYKAVAHELTDGEGQGKLSANLPVAPALLRRLAGVSVFDTTEAELNEVERRVRLRTVPPLRAVKPIRGGDPFLKHVPDFLRAAKTGMRVLIVSSQEIAGQDPLLLKLLNHHTPHAARLVLYEHTYINYPGQDIVLEDSGVDGVKEAYALAEQADFFHFIRQVIPNDDLAWRRRMHPHNSLVQYYGSQLRGNPTAIMGWHERTGIMGLSAWDWTMLERSPLPYHVPMLCDVAAVRGTGPRTVWDGKKPLRICHPTTRRGFKKTNLFIEAVAAANRRLREANWHALIEPVIIEGVSNEECIGIKRTCHATFDQLSTGIYGMSAVESMALSHPVVGGISAWGRSVMPGLPITHATEDTLTQALVDLVVGFDAQDWRGSMDAASDWARKHHDLRVVAPRIRHLYDHIRYGNRLLP